MTTEPYYVSCESEGVCKEEPEGAVEVNATDMVINVQGLGCTMPLRGFVFRNYSRVRGDALTCRLLNDLAFLSRIEKYQDIPHLTEEGPLYVDNEHTRLFFMYLYNVTADQRDPNYEGLEPHVERRRGKLVVRWGVPMQVAVVAAIRVGFTRMTLQNGEYVAESRAELKLPRYETGHIPLTSSTALKYMLAGTMQTYITITVDRLAGIKIPGAHHVKDFLVASWHLGAANESKNGLYEFSIGFRQDDPTLIHWFARNVTYTHDGNPLVDALYFSDDFVGGAKGGGWGAWVRDSVVSFDGMLMISVAACVIYVIGRKLDIVGRLRSTILRRAPAASEENVSPGSSRNILRTRRAATTTARRAKRD